MKYNCANRYRQPRLDGMKHTIKRIRVFPIPLLIPVMLLPFLGRGVAALSILLIPVVGFWIWREMRKHRAEGSSYQADIQKGWRQTKDRAQTDVRFCNLLILFAGGLLCLFLLCPPLGIMGAISAAYFVLISPDRFPSGGNKGGGSRTKTHPSEPPQNF